MYSYEEQCVMDLSDNYTLLYSFLGREVLDAFGGRASGPSGRAPAATAGTGASAPGKSTRPWA